jgi:hypothetical protein
MLNLRYAAGRHAQRRGLDRQRQDPRPKHADDPLPGCLHCIPWDQRSPQPIPLELAQVGQHFLLPRLGLGKPFLGAGAFAGRPAGSRPCTSATVHILSNTK